MYCVLHSSSNENRFALSTNTVLATKFPTEFTSTLLCFLTNYSKCYGVDTLFSICVTRLKHVQIHKYLCKCLLLVYKGKLVLLLEKKNRLCITRNETKVHWQSKFLLSLHVVLYQSSAFTWFIITNVTSIMAHRRYIYRFLWMSFECAAHLGKSCVNATQFRRVFRKTKKSWIAVCCKCWLKVQISFHWKRCVGHRTAWNIFRSHIDHQTIWKNLKLTYKSWWLNMW